MADERLSTDLQYLRSLAPGRHYGASTDSDCWVMVGRDLRDVSTWSIVPPAASLTLGWGKGGCIVDFSGGSLTVGSGDWMWIDAGFAHRGENLPGSDFLSVFIPEKYVKQAALHVAPIGAAAKRAPTLLGAMLTHHAVLLLRGESTLPTEGPFLDAILDWVGMQFQPLETRIESDNPVARAAAMFRDHESNHLQILDIALAVGLSPTGLSREFRKHFHLTPKGYRKQLRLAIATRSLAAGSSVSDAAHDAGFADSAHLSRTFRDQYGITPSIWSRRLLGPVPPRSPATETA